MADQGLMEDSMHTTTESSQNFYENYAGVMVLFVATLCCALYLYFSPLQDGAFSGDDEGIFSFLKGDLPAYATRFSSSFLFFGLIPAFSLGLFLVFGQFFSHQKISTHKSLRSRDWNYSLLGLGRPSKPVLRWWPFWLLLIFFLLSGWLASRRPDMAIFYPYSKFLMAEVRRGLWEMLVWHFLAYTLLYYLPWEIFFRGFLILPLLTFFLREKKQGVKAFTLASIQIIPSVLLHVGHPFSESVAAIFFGLLSAYLVLRFRSIWPSFILHASAGLSLDLALILRN